VAQSHLEADFTHAAALGRATPFGAPEQTGRMGRTIDYRADCYAVGALMYWVLCGEPPFTEAGPLALLHALLTRAPAPLHERLPRAGPSLSRVVQKLLTKNPEARYQSAHGLRADLQRCLAIAEGAAVDEGFAPGLQDRRIVPALP